MIDIARFSIAPVSQDRDTLKPPSKKTIAGGRASRSVCTPAERRAIHSANGRRALEGARSRRGVTLWHKAAIALDQIEAETPGVWSTAREVWARIPTAKGVEPTKVSRALMYMSRSGRTARVEIPGRTDRGGWRPSPNGGVYWHRKPRWAYRLTAAGLEQAAEGRQRIAEGRPDEAVRPGRCGRPRGPGRASGTGRGRRAPQTG